MCGRYKIMWEDPMSDAASYETANSKREALNKVWEFLQRGLSVRMETGHPLIGTFKEDLGDNIQMATFHAAKDEWYVVYEGNLLLTFNDSICTKVEEFSTPEMAIEEFLKRYGGEKAWSALVEQSTSTN